MPLPLALLAASPLIAKLGTALVGIGSAAATGYSIYKNKKDTDYQKALQRDVFNREDNAVQRRMMDLQAAGLNPNLAAGSAAGAGAVVGRSNTPGINGNPLGDALDYASHLQQLRNEYEQNKILKNQSEITKYQAEQERTANNLSKIELFNLLGVDADVGVGYDGRVKIYPNIDFQPFDNPGGWSILSELGENGLQGVTRKITGSNAPIMNYFNWQYNNAKNSADMLQKDADWYTADKIVDYLGTGASIFSGAGSGFLNFQRAGRYRR